MMNAVARGHKEVAKVFFQFGYTMDTMVKGGKMLFEWAIEFGHSALIEVVMCMHSQPKQFKLCNVHSFLLKSLLYTYALNFVCIHRQ